MKYLSILALAVVLSACGNFDPMSEAESKAFAACIEKGWVPQFQAQGSFRRLSCERK